MTCVTCSCSLDKFVGMLLFISVLTCKLTKCCFGVSDEKPNQPTSNDQTTDQHVPENSNQQATFTERYPDDLQELWQDAGHQTPETVISDYDNQYQPQEQCVPISEEKNTANGSSSDFQVSCHHLLYKSCMSTVTDCQRHTATRQYHYDGASAVTNESWSDHINTNNFDTGFVSVCSSDSQLTYMPQDNNTVQYSAVNAHICLTNSNDLLDCSAPVSEKRIFIAGTAANYNKQTCDKATQTVLFRSEQERSLHKQLNCARMIKNKLRKSLSDLRNKYKTLRTAAMKKMRQTWLICRA